MIIDMIYNQMKDINSKRERHDIENALRNALQTSKASILFIIEKEKRAIGFAFCNIGSGIESGSDYLWINEIYIDKDHRGKEHSSELLKYIEAWSIKKNIKAICCITGIKNDKAQKMFYKNQYTMDQEILVEKTL